MNAKLPKRLDITVFFESGGYDIHPYISTDTRPFDLDDIGYSMLAFLAHLMSLPCCLPLPSPLPRPLPALRPVRVVLDMER